MFSPTLEPRTEAAAGPVEPPTIRVTHVVFDFDGGGLESLVAAMARRFQALIVAIARVKSASSFSWNCFRASW